MDNDYEHHGLTEGLRVHPPSLNNTPGGPARDFAIPHTFASKDVYASLPADQPLISPIAPSEEDVIVSASLPVRRVDHSPSYPVSLVLLIEETAEKAAAASVELVAVSNTGRLWADARRDKKKEQDSSRGSASSFCTLDTPRRERDPTTNPVSGLPLLSSRSGPLAALDTSLAGLLGGPSALASAALPNPPPASTNLASTLGPKPAAAIESVTPSNTNITNERVIQISSPPDVSNTPEDINVYVCVKEPPMNEGLRCSLVVLDASGEVSENPLQTEALGVNGTMWEVGVLRIQPGSRGWWIENSEQKHASQWGLMRPQPAFATHSSTLAPTLDGLSAAPFARRPDEGTTPGMNLGVADDPSGRISKVKSKIYGKSKRIIFYTLTLDDLKGFFNLPRDEVARELGICVTLLKKICRRNGIKQWPYRKLKNIDARIAALEHKSASMNASSAPESWNREYSSSIEILKRERENVISLQDGNCGL